MVPFLADDLGVLTTSVPFFSLCQRDQNLLGGGCRDERKGGKPEGNEQGQSIKKYKTVDEHT